MQYTILFILTIIKITLVNSTESDITNIVFEGRTNILISAFGDFNSDELTDVFILSNNGKTFEILLGSDVEPLLRPKYKCDFKNLEITSIIPGDFDGDVYMDVMILTKTKKKNEYNIFINWGGSDVINCTNEEEPLLTVYGEPLALDYNKNMIIDLFGLSIDRKRTFWIFDNSRKSPTVIEMAHHNHNAELSVPHAHAYLDLNNDFTADLFVCTKENFEVWRGLDEGFTYSSNIDLPTGNDKMVIGQSLFLDIELKGQINQIIPICFDTKCVNSTLLVQSKNRFHDLHVSFKDNDNQQWMFIAPDSDDPSDKPYSTMTLRGGDFNMDGYPDLLLTLMKQIGRQTQTFLLENVPCERSTCGPLSRTFEVKWKALAPFSNGTVMGAFYDFFQDGILDVILIEKTAPNTYKPLAFRNTLDYDANFVKVIVLTGLTNDQNPTKLTPLGRKKRTYGTNLPGPRIVYYTTTQEGDIQHGTSIQIPQSAYFSLHLPYTIFGLGRTPNFVDSLTVGLANCSRTWTQLIPNSQMIVVPSPITEPNKWKAQLFVTPSKLILMSVIALGGTCLIIMAIILGLYIKEKREDKIEKLQEAHRFHFDAM